MRKLAASLAAAALALLVAPPAAADDVTGPEFAELVGAAAAGDDEARALLADVTSVDGTPIDTDRLLTGASRDVAARLSTLSALPVERPRPAPEREQATADAIREATGTNGGQLAPRRGPVDDVVPEPARRTLASPVFWMILGAVALAFAGVTVAITARRRARFTGHPQRAVAKTPTPSREGPVARAEDALAAGDASLAVRLRFQEGTRRLAQAGVVPAAESATSGMVRRAVGGPVIADLASTFDRVAYGGVPASREEGELALEAWARIERTVHRA